MKNRLILLERSKEVVANVYKHPDCGEEFVALSLPDVCPSCGEAIAGLDDAEVIRGKE